MIEQKESEVTQLLRRYSNGDGEALEELLPYVQAELKQMARYWLKSGTPTWQPTMLVDEIFIRILHSEAPRWENRAHFFHSASQQMRHLMIDAARRKKAEKRGGQARVMSLESAPDTAARLTGHDRLLILDDILQKLEQEYPRQAKVFEMRFYMGFDNAEIEQVLGVTERTVRRDWAFAQSWLRNSLGDESGLPRC